MSKHGFWHGYLDAGSKSSAVLRDPELDTGNRKTVYLFNLARNAIIEYNREIVEPKLRDLNGDEAEISGSLDSAYAIARRRFSVARTSAAVIPDEIPVKKPASSGDDFDDIGDDEDVDADDLDLELEEET